jgi:hypothetical protein
MIQGDPVRIIVNAKCSDVPRVLNFGASRTVFNSKAVSITVE